MERNPQLFDALIDAIPSPVFSKDSAGRYLGCNRAFETYLGRTKGDIIGKTVFDISPRGLAERYKAKDDELFLHPGTQEYEAQVSYADGSVHDVIFHKATFNGENGQVAGLVGVILDVTKRKHVETGLKESEKKYRDIFESLYNIFYQVTLDGTLQMISPSVYDRAGYRPEELIGRNVMEIYADPAERAELMAQLDRHHTVSDYEIKLKTKSGEIRQVALSSRMVFDDNGEPVVINGIIRDITEQKLAKEALKESEQRFHQLVDDLPEYVFVYQRERIRYANRASLSVLGYTIEQITTKNLFDFVAEKDRPLVAENIKKRAIGQPVKSYEINIFDAAGYEHSVIADAEVISYQNEPAVLAVLHDITERKQAEHALRASEEKYRLIAENTADCITVMDLNLKITYVSPSIEKLRGYTVPEAMTQSFDQILLPSSLHKMNKLFEEQMALEAGGQADPSRTLTIELEEYCKDGSTIWADVTISMLRDSNLKPTGIVSITRNITPRKRAEQDLIESKALIEAVVENVPQMIFLKEAKDLRFILFNRAGEELLGYDRSALLGKNNLDLFPPEQAAHFMAKDREVLDGAAGMLDIPEEPILTAKKGQRLLHTQKICIRGVDGSTKYLLGISEDITDRARAEQALRDSEKMFRLLFEQASDSIIMIELPPGGPPTIRDANATALKLLGYSRDELIGQPIAMLNEEDNSERLIAERGARAQAAEGALFEVRHRRKDGTMIDAEVSVKELMIGGKRLALSIERDITEHKREQLLQESLYRISELSLSVKNLDELYAGIHHIVGKLMSADNFFLTIVDERTGLMGFPYFIDQYDPHPAPRPLGNGLTERVLRSGTLLLKNPETDATLGSFDSIGHVATSWLGVPLRNQGQTFGAMVVQVYDTVKIFSQREADILSFVADHVAAAIIRRQNDTELRKLSSALEQSANMIVITDLDANIVYVNRTFCQMTGYAMNEVIGQNPRILKSGEMTRSAYGQMWRELLSGGTWKGEFHNKKKNGELYWEQATLTTIRDDQGKPSSYMAIKEDITEWKRAQEELRVSEERFQQVAENASECIWELDQAGVFSYCSDIITKILGYTPAEMVGKLHFEDLPVEPTGSAPTEEARQGFFKHEPLRGFITGYKHKDGRTVICEINAVPFFDSHGEFKGYRGTTRDITMRRALEEERERLIIELQNSLDNIKTLKGLVPICSNCKKIRDDKGYWQQVEVYVSQHTEADFSHGLCDECAHKLYPEYFADKKNPAA